jgi:hypothetical protein
MRGKEVQGFPLSFPFPKETGCLRAGEAPGKELLHTMKQKHEITETLDPFGTLRSLRDANLEAWSKIMIDVVNSEAYSRATSQWLDGYLTLSQPFQRVVETTMTQVLTGLNMPTRTEVTSLAERMTNIEIRLDDLDARLDDIFRAIQALSPSKSGAGTSTKGKEVQ